MEEVKMGFNISDLNIEFINNNIEVIIDRILCCSQAMVDDKNMVENKENKITSRLCKYLNKNNENFSKLPFRFEKQQSENYNEAFDTDAGIIDIKVMGTMYLSNRNDNDYYIIECKRIDGTRTLNRKYIVEGISRFLSGQYTSYYNKNIMLGFIVKGVDIQKNTNDINEIQDKNFNNYVKEKLTLLKKTETKFWIYSSSYYLKNKPDLELRHIFYNFSSIITCDAK